MAREDSESSKFSKCVINTLSNTENKTNAKILVESQDLKGQIDVDTLMNKTMVSVNAKHKKDIIFSCLCTALKRLEFCPKPDERQVIIDEINILKAQLQEEQRKNSAKDEALENSKKTTQTLIDKINTLESLLRKMEDKNKGKIFNKGGNDGTASCEVFCKGSDWPGGLGICVAGKIDGTGERLTCNERAFDRKKVKVGVVCICADPEKIFNE